jgi:hypothetical protein
MDKRSIFFNKALYLQGIWLKLFHIKTDASGRYFKIINSMEIMSKYFMGFGCQKL